MDDKRRDELLKAVSDGDGNACARLIEAEAIDPNVRLEGKETRLHRAAREGHADVCRALLAAKAKPNPKESSHRKTPLHYAAEQGHAEVCRVLLEGKADPHAVDKDGSMPLHLAIFEMHADVCRALLEGGASVGAERISKSQGGVKPIWLCMGKLWRAGPAAAEQVFEVLAALLDHGADPNEEMEGRAPLHSAALNGALDICRLLVAKGADVNLTDSDGSTPLHAAAVWKRAAVCAYLVEAGADMEARNEFRSTAMDYAIGEGDDDVVMALQAKAVRDDMETRVAKGKEPGEKQSAKRGAAGGL